MPVTLYLIYDGAWTVVANSVEYASEKDILALADFSLIVPTGTYQYYDMGGMLYSIRIFETPDDLENPYHCDIILYNEVWNPVITNDYFGPVELTDELNAIICGGICFGFDAAGAPYLVEPRMLYDGSIVDSIKPYSGGTGLADGLNALIDLAETSGQPLSNHAVTVYAHEYGIAEEDILRGETTSKEDMDAYMEIALLDPLFNPDDPTYIIPQQRTAPKATVS